MGKLTWEISEEHSQISFKLKYFDLSHITGQFLHFSGKVIANEFFDSPEIYLFLDTNSIEAYQEHQNTLFRSKDVLYAAQFPFIEFSSVDGCTLKSGRIWELTGDIMIKDIKKPLTLIVSYTDIRIDEKRGLAKFRLFGELNRSEFGLRCSGEDQYGDAISISTDIVLHAII